MANCKICEQQFGSDELFHRHLKTHKIKIADYYVTYEPRRDKLTGELIPFKSVEHYFTHDFTSKSNLKIWLDKVSKQGAQTYCKQLLLARKERKNIQYTPSQVELRSIMSPGIIYLDQLFGSYYKTCMDLGFINKYEDISLRFHEELLKNNKIIIDTREQLPLKFDVETATKKLDFGDYALEKNPIVFIERKSLSDFISTFSFQLERFEREIERAMKTQAYLLILVESSLTDALKFNHLPYINKFTKLQPEFVFRNVRDLIQKYPNIQFLFANGRKEAAELVKKIFKLGERATKVDLQLMYDKKAL